MKVLITGAAGFIGSHTVVEFVTNGFDVVGVDNYCNSKRGVPGRLKALLNKEVSFYECDLRNKDALSLIFEKEKPEAVIHFAALKSNADSILNPGLYYDVNIQSTFNLLSCMKKYSVKYIVFSSSATVYGDNKNCPIKETEPVGKVISPYGMTKYLNELYLQHQAETFRDFQAVALRYFNPIGSHPSGLIGEDSPDAVPNNLMLYLIKVANGELPYLRIFGDKYNTRDGTGVRDFIHVCDIANGHVAALRYLLNNDAHYTVFNLGTGMGHTVLEVVHLFERVNGVSIPTKVVDVRPGDVEMSFASVEKAKKLLCWEAKRSLEDCLRDLWKFAKMNRNG